MTATARRWPRRLACVRHALVGRLPSRARSRLAGWAPPWTRRFAVPCPTREWSPSQHRTPTGWCPGCTGSGRPATNPPPPRPGGRGAVTPRSSSTSVTTPCFAHAANPRAKVHAVEPFPDASQHLHAALLRVDAATAYPSTTSRSRPRPVSDASRCPHDHRTGCPRPAGRPPRARQTPRPVRHRRTYAPCGPRPWTGCWPQMRGST